MIDTYVSPPFRITRLSHIALQVRDLEASLEFYQRLAGLILSHRDGGTACLRAVEETSHHSLILTQGDEPSCDVVGFRVLEDSDLDAAEAYFAGLDIATVWRDRPGQGRILGVTLPSGILIELTARMDRLPRLLTEYSARKGGGALRLDHCQVIVPDVEATGATFLNMGFRAAEVIEQGDTGRRVGMFLHRKNNPHDIVLSMAAGPRLHHFAFITPDLQSMFRACDIAGEMGIGNEVERGPGRHGPGNSAFVYFRDPDGHRIELILPPMQIMDPDEPPKVWSNADKHMVVPWGGPASQRWREEATLFTGVPLSTDGDLARWVADSK
ncbi:VOC family protein [Puniceibacterium sp. IMCC21224]|uniref:VOC family protein n=1 Tax=Puniceibacterium sp. IMCC21224 TaxID=1618204 RepID=UPI00064DA941|nr:VOC family protein [Puniceibacterium sp. IMCC21224]KMK65169.1 lactoylglutathione lyase-like lyase [Puniceibacterium sp. IMCC21224]